MTTMATLQLFDIGPESRPHQPADFEFPKREFGKSKIVRR